MKYLLISLTILISLFLEITLFNMWRADKSYALGKNYDSIQQYLTAYPLLMEAVEINPNEPTFKDELSYNQAVLASLINSQVLSATNSAIASLSAEQKMSIVIPQIGLSTNDLITQAIENSNKVVEKSPNSMPFWKNRTKMFYQLSTIDSKYNLSALTAIQKAAQLAPTDAKVSYNLALLYGKNGQITNAIKVLEETIKLKPDYKDAKSSLELYLKEISKP